MGWKREQLITDLETLLATDAGKRFFGHELDPLWRGTGYELSAFQQGQRDHALWLANRIREIDPRMIGECDGAYRESVTREKEEAEDGGW
ncbi:MAG: hypothetical protein IJR14_07500 [Synergistaceae bacterium]|nr:hypothetical protein [Synergistaceae bacterium]